MQACKRPVDVAEEQSANWGLPEQSWAGASGVGGMEAGGCTLRAGSSGALPPTDHLPWEASPFLAHFPSGKVTNFIMMLLGPCKVPAKASEFHAWAVEGASDPHTHVLRHSSACLWHLKFHHS